MSCSRRPWPRSAHEDDVHRDPVSGCKRESRHLAALRRSRLLRAGAELRGQARGIRLFLQKKHWGQGYASEALAELLRYAFEEDGAWRVDGTCVADNLRSARVMEKCGLVFEGERRNYEWHVDSLKSRRYYGILKEEWEEQHGKR